MSDLISRQALKNALTDWQMQYAEKGKDVERFETLGAVIDLVEQMPTIEPKRGKWIPNSPFTGNCSECGGKGNLKDNYCSTCGAKMGGMEQKGEIK